MRKVLAHSSDPRSAAYVLAFTARVASGLVRPHRLRLPESLLEWTEIFEPSAPQLERWTTFFDARAPGDERIPFTFFWPSLQRAFFVFSARMGLNYRHVLHLGVDLDLSPELWNGGASLRGPLLVQTVLEDIINLGRSGDDDGPAGGRIALVMRTLVFNAPRESTDAEMLAQSPLAVMTNTIFVRGVPRGDIAELNRSKIFNRSPADRFRGLSRRGPELRAPGPQDSSTVKAVPFRFEPGAGLRYGLVSGDLNPLHTSPLLARVFGFKEAFIQGMATANLVLRFLARLTTAERPPIRLSLTFTRPVPLGPMMRLLVAEDGRLEVTGTAAGEKGAGDDETTLHAFGTATWS